MTANSAQLDIPTTNAVTPLLAVVLPVYNEADNIGPCLRKLYAALREHPHELLVCYDFDGDSTLPAIAAMADKPPTVKLVKNNLGKGVAHALQAGFDAALADGADVIVTSMADLSDPPEVIPAMAEKIRHAGAHVVSGSRYMRGGSQTGGPWLKRTLSRVAGLSLHYVAGVATHDATTNFRGYSAAFLRKTRVASKHGFEVALELTTKAHRQGMKIAEVPSSWTDRSAGESRFRLWKWLPRYLYWYFTAMAWPLAVWTVFAVMLAGALRLVHRFGSNLPFYDEWALVPHLTGDKANTLSWLFSPHNEHRIPLPRLVYLALSHLGGHDFRVGMYASVALLAGVAVLLILLARKLRGRSSWADAIFPLLVLSIAHFENLLSSFQLQFTLSSALLTVLFVTLAWPTRTSLSFRRWLIILATLLLLQASGGVGILFVPPIILWLLGSWTYKHFSKALVKDAPHRASPQIEKRKSKSEMILLLLSFIPPLLCGLSLLSVHPVGPTANPRATLRGAAQFLATGLGMPTAEDWIFTAAFLLVLLIITFHIVVHVWRHRPTERLRIAGLLAFLASCLLLALSVGYGRGALGAAWAMAPRYATLAVWLPLTLVFIAICYAPRLSNWLMLAIALWTLALYPQTLSRAHTWGAILRGIHDDSIARLRQGQPLEVVASRYADFFWLYDEKARHVIPDSSSAALHLLARHHLGPFTDRTLVLPPLPQGPWREYELPLRPTIFHDVQQDGPVYHGFGEDPYFGFDFPSTYVAKIRLYFTARNPQNAFDLLEIFWMNAPTERDFSVAHSSHIYVAPTSAMQTRTFDIYQPITTLRIDPDVGPCTFTLHKVVLLVPESAPVPTTLPATR